MNMRRSIGSWAFDACNLLFMLALVMVTFYPLYHLFIVSVSNGHAVLRGEVSFWPVGPNLDTYRLLLQDTSILRSYGNTVLYTAVGTAVNLICTILCAYPLSKREFYGRSFFTLMIVLTMFFSGGLIPTYLLVQKLHMIDTMWALIVPGAISAWNMFVMRTFFQGIPGELFESARMDGAGEWMVLWRIALPLSLPIVATISMFYAVGHWNSFFPALIYLNEKAKYPVQILLRNIVVMGQMSEQSQELSGPYAAVTSTNIKYAVIIVVVAPIVAVYPFIQKYFIKGVMIGSLKG
ncbi:L-arabinose transport system permease protein AraQ [Paenibacillus solanacearum]|uniref:L-arabinose transport system permease protein AraQ n=1 Tax=Paenibacillus solanacearum TaxID=2048548 RepID=A0A916NK27_9BACL|nr:carbohydrate ABC transporter permease [Paenibacillus solanacearum]CAG7636631.1 L-arabinose transport system permease protein AraQ [Paenibacillus solanacearum]